MPATVEDTYHALRCLELLTLRASGATPHKPAPLAMISPEIHVDFLKQAGVEQLEEALSHPLLHQDPGSPGVFRN